MSNSLWPNGLHLTGLSLSFTISQGLLKLLAIVKRKLIWREDGPGDKTPLHGRCCPKSACLLLSVEMRSPCRGVLSQSYVFATYKNTSAGEAITLGPMEHFDTALVPMCVWLCCLNQWSCCSYLSFLCLWVHIWKLGYFHLSASWLRGMPRVMDWSMQSALSHLRANWTLREQCDLAAVFGLREVVA